MRKARSKAVCASISFFELMHASMLNGNFALAANINGDGLDAPSDINVGYINFTGLAKGALLSETTGKSMACDIPYDLSEE